MKDFALLGFDMVEIERVARRLARKHSMKLFEVECDFVKQIDFDFECENDVCRPKDNIDQSKKNNIIYLIRCDCFEDVVAQFDAIPIIYIKTPKSRLKDLIDSCDIKYATQNLAIGYIEYDELDDFALKNSTYVVESSDDVCNRINKLLYDEE